MLPIQSLKRHEGAVNAIVLHHDYLLTASDDHEIKVRALELLVNMLKLIYSQLFRSLDISRCKRVTSQLPTINVLFVT